MGENTLMIGHRLRPRRPRPFANRLGQAARPARRRGDHKQEVVELNSKVPVRDERSKKTRKSRTKSLTFDLLPMQERPSVKKLLAYEKEVNERFAKTV